MTKTVEKETKIKTEKMIKVPKDFFYGTGKRKSAIARVWLFKGTGKVVINKKPLSHYGYNEQLENNMIEPLTVLGLEKEYDIKITVSGGGVVGQSDACQLGVARALEKMNIEFRPQLKKRGLLTRDPRVKERKKYGRKKARKGFQYRKR